MRLSVAIVLAVAVVGCSRSESYVAAQRRYSAQIGAIATYAPLLDPSTYEGADMRVVVPTAQAFAVAHICAVAHKGPPLAEGASDVERRVAAALDVVGAGCCDGASSSEPVTASGCDAAVKAESGTLVTVDAEAVKAGLPVGTITATAPQLDPAGPRAEVIVIRGFTRPTPEESKLTALWNDPTATTAPLKTACQAALASDPEKTEPATGPATIAATKAHDTALHCSALTTYANYEALDARSSRVEAPALRSAAIDTSICMLMQMKQEIAAPVSMRPALADIVAKRCPTP